MSTLLHKKVEFVTLYTLNALILHIVTLDCLCALQIDWFVLFLSS